MSDKYVVVSGAAKGIGRATALLLDKKGFTVFAGVRNLADGDSLRQNASSRLRPILLDVTSQSQIAEAAHQIREVVGESGLAGLVNNAGVAVAAPLEFLPIAELRNQLEVNLIGQVAVTQALLACIRQAKGRIINISSIGGKIVTPMIGAYTASKYALEAVTDSLRLELKPWGIEVVSIEPGTIATPIWDSAQATADRLLNEMPPQVNELYAGPIAKIRATVASAGKRGIPPERVAEVIEQALTVRRPKTRYLVGPDAKIAGRIIVRLPDRLRDRLIAMA